MRRVGYAAIFGIAALGVVTPGVLVTRSCQADEIPAETIPCVYVDPNGQTVAGIAWDGPNDALLAEAIAWLAARQRRIHVPRLGEIFAVLSDAHAADLGPNDLVDYTWPAIYVALPEGLRLGTLHRGVVLIAPRISGRVRDPNGCPVDGIWLKTDPYVGGAITDANGCYWIEVPWDWSGAVVPQGGLP